MHADETAGTPPAGALSPITRVTAGFRKLGVRSFSDLQRLSADMPPID